MVLLTSGACDRGNDGAAPPPTFPGPTTSSAGAGPEVPASDQAVEMAAGDHPRGGSARVGVWAAPDPAAPTLGGAAVRSLVLPQLFVARPDGRWSPALVEPRSDLTATDSRSASFRLRTGSTWSDGTPLGVDDLRRSLDPRFVSEVQTSDDGLVTLRFVSPLPGWRRLWSGQDSIPAPAAGVWGGPFVVSSMTPGLETVLARNERWWGASGPFLDEVRLVLVPDATTARLLLARGELDAVMPPAATARTPQFEALVGVSVDRVERGGWSVSVLANATALSLEERRGLFAAMDRAPFVRTLLAGEATQLDGFAGPEDATWVGAVVNEEVVGGLAGESVDLVGAIEEPMTPLIHRSIQKRVRLFGGNGARVELRAAEFDRVEGWLADGSFEAAVVVALDPLGGCWTCRWSSAVGEDLSRAADAGDPTAVAAVETQLRDDARVLPLWRPASIVAWRDGLRGVRANGYAAGAAWNAWEWWRAAAPG